MDFYKYHALGNDYILMDPRGSDRAPPSREQIRLICHRNYGIGGDGILWGPTASSAVRFALRIFNPDGSEAEKSGNGLRIFARYLWDRKLVDERAFSVSTLGGVVTACVEEGGRSVRVDMGIARFGSQEIPVTGPIRDVLDEPIVVGNHTLRFSAVTVGNPHCVIFPAAADSVDEQLARLLGPNIEVDSRFPNRTNVQFVRVLDRGNIRIEIWERGAGYTLASGSSASAATAVARRLGFVDDEVNVHMPGGTLEIRVDPEFRIEMTGPVTGVARGALHGDMLAALEALAPTAFPGGPAPTA